MAYSLTPSIRRFFSLSSLGFIVKAPKDKGVRSNSRFATQQHATINKSTQ
jgi:hypothetical protein